MFKGNRRSNPNIVSLAVITFLLALISALIGFVALSTLIGYDFSFRSNSVSEYPTPKPAATPSDFLIGTPDPSALSDLTHKGLGFGLTYPRAWRQREKGLQVILSPSADGLDPDNLQEAAIWFGIPADNTTNTAELLTRIQADLSPDSQVLNTDTVIIGGQPWQSTNIRFNHEQLGGPALSTIATTSKNGVGYYIVAIAPAEQWNSIEPGFQAILDSFHFTTKAVLRPTDATPPPTPTPTPTPMIYVVQSGDTLLKIALQYGVNVETLATRNGIDDPRSLRTGTKLIIPIKRR